MNKTQHELFRNKDPKQHKMQPTNLQHSISSPTYPCVLTFAVFPSKEHESKVPEPLNTDTAPPCNDILTLIKFMRDMRMW